MFLPISAGLRAFKGLSNHQQQAYLKELLRADFNHLFLGYQHHPPMLCYNEAPPTGTIDLYVLTLKDSTEAHIS